MQDIYQKFERYGLIDWARLSRKDLGPTGDLSDTEPVFKRLKSFFDNIVSNQIISTLPATIQSQINNSLQSLLTFIDSRVITFLDVPRRQELINDLKGLEVEIYNSLGRYHFLFTQQSDFLDKNFIEDLFENKYDVILKSFKNEWDIEKDNIKNIAAELTELKNKFSPTEELIDELIENADLIKLALERARDLIEKDKEAVSLILKANATDSAKKAAEHKTLKINWLKTPFFNKFKIPYPSGSIFWLLLSSLFGATIVALSLLLLIRSGENISIGSALLHFAILLIPAYFTIFSAQQYSNHRRLYEAYSFKDVATQTMINLRNQFPSNEPAKDPILLRSLNVIFTEPVIENKIKYDKQLILELVNLLKTQKTGD